ncbi:MAG: desulfoferrodoxin [Nanoarchaeota archaeon]
MNEENDIFKCNICGNVVELFIAKQGSLVCCGKDMVKLTANTVDAAVEKHVPVVEINDNIVTVTVGEVEHPMNDEHYIRLIELLQNGAIIKSRYLKPNEKPVAKFVVDDTSNLKAREYCNLHGLWANK